MEKRSKFIIGVVLALLLINIASLFNASAVISDSANRIRFQIEDRERIVKLNNALKDVYKSGLATENISRRYSNEYTIEINYMNSRSRYSLHSGRLHYTKNIGLMQTVNRTVIVDSKELSDIANLIYLEMNRFEYGD